MTTNVWFKDLVHGGDISLTTSYFSNSGATTPLGRLPTTGDNVLQLSDVGANSLAATISCDSWTCGNFDCWNFSDVNPIIINTTGVFTIGTIDSVWKNTTLTHVTASNVAFDSTIGGYPIMPGTAINAAGDMQAAWSWGTYGSKTVISKANSISTGGGYTPTLSIIVTTPTLCDFSTHGCYFNSPIFAAGCTIKLGYQSQSGALIFNNDFSSSKVEISAAYTGQKLYNALAHPDPAANKVMADAGNYGPIDAAITPTLALSNVLVAAGGTNIGSAAQLAADFANIATPTAGQILSGVVAHAIDNTGAQTTVTGTNIGAAAQLAADFAKIATPTAAQIKNGITAHAIDSSGNQTTVNGTYSPGTVVVTTPQIFPFPFK